MAPPLQLSGAKDASIQFKDVYFKYGENKEIFKGLNFNVPAGKTVALVGGSGSGYNLKFMSNHYSETDSCFLRKSTVVRLLYRFFEPQQGQILINGQDITKVDVESLRRVISVVPQVVISTYDKIFNESEIRKFFFFRMRYFSITQYFTT